MHNPNQQNIEKHKAYFAHLKKKGVTTTSYSCPACDFSIETAANTTDSATDSAVTCPSCENLHLKVLLPNGGEIKISRI
ncbi:hypothetical protein [Photobacterium kishitanii]|uniref:Uncharacterized protein n=1 Tax=Photobacterium kishitanii TaxID=318456 RepID=A0A2T3KLE8_9GAMM|nr:hypothetical protein [Photobacterium kishitanii]PSV00544.1 hypothetical protein C9J27_05260 [Photobacterium kishitanii]